MTRPTGAATRREDAATERPWEVAAADGALRDLRRATLGRAVRDTWSWIVRAIGWGSVVYLIGWTIVLLLAAVQSLPPLSPVAADAARRWLTPAASILLALALLAGARSVVTPVWLDRRDLVHLAASAARATAVLTWPGWRAVLPGVLAAVASGAALALVLPALLGDAAPAALVTLPAVAVLLLTVRWRAAVTRGRDRAAWTLVLAAVVAAAASFAAAVAGSESAAWWGAPAAATVGRLPLPTSLAVAALCLAAVVAFAARTLSATTATIPAVVLRQSLLLGELRAIATLRLMAAVTMTEIDPGGGFAAARARDALRDRPTAWSPRWRPRVPRRGGATSAFAWLGVVRAWRASPWVTLALVPLTVVAVIVTPPQGPFGGASLLPSLALAWAAAQLHPGRLPWPGWQFDERARVIALLWLVGAPAWLVTSLDAIVRVIAEASPAPHNWVLLPLALAAAAVVDLLAARTASPRGPATWLTAAVIVAAPAALAGWFGVEASAAASLCAVVWVLAAWARVATALGPGR